MPIFLACLFFWQFYFNFLAVFKKKKNDLEHKVQIVFLSYTQPRKREASADFLIPAM